MISAAAAARQIAVQILRTPNLPLFARATCEPRGDAGAPLAGAAGRCLANVGNSPRFGLRLESNDRPVQSPGSAAAWGAGPGSLFQRPPWRAGWSGTSHGELRDLQGLANDAEWGARQEKPPTVNRNVEHNVKRDVNL